MTKQYLGDGVYVEHDGYALELTTDNGIERTNRIVLEPQVYAALVAYVERLTKQQQGAGPGEADLPSDLDVSGLVSDEEPQLSAARDNRGSI